MRLPLTIKPWRCLNLRMGFDDGSFVSYAEMNQEQLEALFCAQCDQAIAALRAWGETKSETSLPKSYVVS
jgi:hypothetical protein